MTLSIGLIAVAYLIGAIPFGLLAGRMKGIDIRQHGSGNIGATNAGRVLGRSIALAVFVLDFLKGFAPVFVAGLLLGQRPSDVGYNIYLAWVFVAGGCVLGHMFPIYLKFKGGKGVATSLGVILGLFPYFTLPGVLTFAIWGVVLGVSRYVSLAWIVAAGLFPIMFALSLRLRTGSFTGPAELWPLHAFGIMIAVLVIVRHRSNVRRLIAGTESKIGASRGS